jgi:hypothetical protein
MQLCIRKGDLKDLIKGEITLDRRNKSVVDNTFSQSNIEIQNDVELEKAQARAKELLEELKRRMNE